ncbi:MAG: NAD(P)H-hydrate dehydratase [Lachnospiraceae bacterium]|nr:NAD(P)H-hydrate dehydratase [Lachnospiraceae bacterium]
MEFLVTSEEMRRYDTYTIEGLGVPDIVLMERAAYGAFEYIYNRLVSEDLPGSSVTVLCGFGNNGGDGLALARLLYQKHVDVSVIMIGDRHKSTRSNLLEQDILINYGLAIIYLTADEAAEHLKEHTDRSDIVIDALFGIGLSRPLSGAYLKITEMVNTSGSYVYALDIPSGLPADGGGYSYPCINADVTITFGFNKVGLVTYPGAAKAGDVILIDMGIDEFSITGERPAHKRITDRNDIDWPNRVGSANKGTYGKLLVIAGSEDVYGAAYMAAKAAFSMGIGMVRVITHVNNRVALETALPEAMYLFYEEPDDIVDSLNEAYKWADGILIGPGIGLDESAEVLVRSVLYDTGIPLLIDADAIRIIADNGSYLKKLAENEKRTVIITPHMGEYAYFTGKSVSDAKERVVQEIKTVADRYRLTIICKDARSLIASHSDSDIYVNSTGNEGMATAGSGDVLSGMCAVLMVQMQDSHKAAAYAAYLHGLAGDDAASRCGNVSMSASDIIDSIPGVI